MKVKRFYRTTAHGHTLLFSYSVTAYVLRNVVLFKQIPSKNEYLKFPRAAAYHDTNDYWEFPASPNGRAGRACLNSGHVTIKN